MTIITTPSGREIDSEKLRPDYFKPGDRVQYGDYPAVIREHYFGSLWNIRLDGGSACVCGSELTRRPSDQEHKDECIADVAAYLESTPARMVSEGKVANVEAAKAKGEKVLAKMRAAHVCSFIGKEFVERGDKRNDYCVRMFMRGVRFG